MTCGLHLLFNNLNAYLIHHENTFSSHSVEFCQFAVPELAVNVLRTKWRIDSINTPEIFPLKGKRFLFELYSTTGTTVEM